MILVRGIVSSRSYQCSLFIQSCLHIILCYPCQCWWWLFFSSLRLVFFSSYFLPSLTFLFTFFCRPWECWLVGLFWSSWASHPLPPYNRSCRGQPCTPHPLRHRKEPNRRASGDPQPRWDSGTKVERKKHSWVTYFLKKNSCLTMSNRWCNQMDTQHSLTRRDSRHTVQL